MRLRIVICIGIACITFCGALLKGDERLEGIACRSVHLAYPTGQGQAFYNEVTVEKSAPGTYFCVCGWNKGYYGIQEKGDGKKVLIFSVWDSNQNDSKGLEEEKRVKLLHKDDKVRVGRFGGEGTGGQSFLDYEWKLGETYRFLVSAKLDGKRTEYSGYFYLPEEKEWKHLITFSTVTGGKNLGGYYSFVEDFKRDRVSTTKARSASYGNAWIKTVKGDWEAITKARFTADKNPSMNINAGINSGRFFLTTGGDTKNTESKLNDLMQLPADEKRAIPESLPKTN
jgi:hypothetical protein